MKPIAHLASGLVLGTCAYALTKDPLHFVASGAGAFLIDVDHALDFIREFGAKNALERLLGSFRFDASGEKLKRLFLVFHSWELLAFLVAFSLWGGGSSYLASFTVGAAVHLVMDQLGNEVRPLTYFMAYRAWVGFKRELLAQ